ncbi:hypothetical protein KSP40_PGU004729 [Platanthera guangdongensis]|uniref:Zinc finger PHD-type domain-containing protein n=1 Tax=Platanthera guangdongensis TaxID=2320717 RepID=A0ABR2MNP4_9ASPA
MKGRSHRPLPSAPLEDWGDGQWTVDCSCGVNFDDGEEMVSCDECGVWVHTRCSRYVRGEVSFACHKCKASSKRSRSAIPSAAANNIAVVHDTEETEVAQLLVELPTKADQPPPAPPIGAPYRPPFRLWAHVPMEERVHVQGVPGGDPSLFRGLSSKIFTPDLWKCTGYVPKKFNFKYKEFPCWEEEERDKASRGADALFSLSKEIVQAAPARSFEKILALDGSRKERGKLLLDTRPFVCVKKERNKLRVLGSHSSKGRKEEPGEEKEFISRKRSREDFDKALADVKEKAGSVPMLDTVKEDLANGVLQVEESVVPDSKSLHNKEDGLHKHSGKGPHEGMENGSKTKHMLVFKTSRRRLSDDEALRPKFSLETPVKVEKVDRPDGKIYCKLNSAAACHVESKNAAKGFTKHEDVVFKEPKNENCVPIAANGGTVNDLEKMKGGVYSNGNHPDAPNIISSSVLCSSSTKKVELNVKAETTDDQVLGNSCFPSLISTGNKHGRDDLTQNQLKSMNSSSMVPEESIKTTPMQPEEQKPQIMQKDSELSQIYKECINTASHESLILHEVIDSAGSSRKCKNSIELDHTSKTYCTSANKSNGVNSSHSTPPVQKVVSHGEEFLNSTALYGSKSPLSSTQNLTANKVSCSPARKAVSVVKQQRVKAITSIDTTTMTSTITEENELGILQQPGKIHPTGAELVGSKSLQTGKNSLFSASKNCSLDSKELLSGPHCQISAETPTASLGTAEATRPLVHSPANQLKSTSLGSSPKIDKTVHSNTQQSPKFLNHSLVMQASTLTNATNLSDEELALLLHQELNSSPRVPRVPRVRLATNTHFATPSTPSTLSKRAHPVGRDQVSFLRRKHKEKAFKDGLRHSRDAISESRRNGRRSPEAKQDESAIFSDSFTKRGRGCGRSCDTVASSKSNVTGTSTEGANSLAVSSEENGTRASLRTPPVNVGGDGTLSGLSLPGLIDEIMNKGKCSTYEELCDSVRPYWRSLRKPNGERYAYFSHSQAVLDCLRNRSQWAHLIDRGPKTNASKRRKLDTETRATELEHEKCGNSQREDFPKGKRNVRKRRLLDRRLVNAKEATSPSAPGTLSDDDAAALSPSSNDGTECNDSDDTGPETCSSSSGDSD